MPNKVEKIIQKMKQQPNGIRFEELKKVLVFYGYTMKSKTGTSHRNFINSYEIFYFIDYVKYCFWLV